MKGNYSNEILKQLNVSSMECNITIKCVGKCKPKDVINLFEKSVDKTFIAQEERDKKKTFRKDQALSLIHIWVRTVFSVC